VNILEHLSVIQLQHQTDGSFQVKGSPHIKYVGVEGQGTVVQREWWNELRLPTYREDWEDIARAKGLSSRQIWFVVLDEAEARLPGRPRFKPERIILPPSCQLELAHTGFVVGLAFGFNPRWIIPRGGKPDDPSLSLPPDIEGGCIIGTALLFDSPLADAAWEGLQRGIFSHVCPTLGELSTLPADYADCRCLIQVSLTTSDFPGFVNAKILKMSES